MKRLALALLLATGCSSELPPAGQVLLHVTTDAPLPSSRDGSGGLFDRLAIDVIPAGASEPCAGCTRIFAVDRDLVDGGDASMGIVPEVGEQGVRARVRLYRGGGTVAGTPRPGSTLEAVVALPETSEEGIVHATVHLAVDTLGAPRGTLEEPADVQKGMPTQGLVGTWSGAQPVPCADDVTIPDDMACIPGRAFWMGDPRLDLSAAEDLDGELERLVVLSPFLLDRSEVTVADFRASGLAVLIEPEGPSENPHEAGGDIEGCAFTTLPGDNEALPVNCVSWDLARAYCESLGKALPTEAQLELAQSGMGRFRFPWGEEAPGCEDAVYARGDECAALGDGVAPVGTAARDVLTVVSPLGEVIAITDLAGNVAEWTADAWNREHEACWGLGVFFDPQCTSFSQIDSTGRTIRGGHYDAPEARLRAAVRARVFNEKKAVSGLVGFRCAASTER